jgi:hypothetical protein
MNLGLRRAPVSQLTSNLIADSYSFLAVERSPSCIQLCQAIAYL